MYERGDGLAGRRVEEVAPETSKTRAPRSRPPVRALCSHAASDTSNITCVI